MIIAGVIALQLGLCKLTAWQPVEGGVYSTVARLVSPYAGFWRADVLVANTFWATVSLGFAYC
jgi:hypothetical protein